MDDSWDAVLPRLKPNKKFVERRKYVAKLKAKQAAREHSRSAPPVKTKKTRKAKTSVGKAKTGKETLVKVKAKALVEEKKKKKKVAAQKAKGKAMKATTHEVAPKARRARTVSDKIPATHSTSTTTGVTVAQTPPPAQARSLLEQAIRGDEEPEMEAMQIVRHDPTLYPNIAFYDDYAERKNAEVASQEELLHKAHVYFKSLAKKDRQLYRAAAQRLREMRAINRRGGDKDGYRYVLPRNVKEMAQQMVAMKGGGGAAVNPDELVSHFGGDDARDTEDKPMRRNKRRSKLLSDFYQFQVTRQWTRNAENFLRRGRASKAMFEAKKHQRSIRKL